MSLLKSLAIAFSMYSRIPMPQFPWEEKDMKYTMCFFPWIGVVIGLLMYGWSWLCFRYRIGALCYTLIGAAISLVITGGFHMDGFMDTMDAFHSYQPKERKLEILKDSHIGAFSVIMLCLYYLIYLGALSEVRSLRCAAILSCGFVISRCLSGIGVVTFRSAKQDGLLYTFASSAQKVIVRAALYIQLAAVLLVMLLIAWLPACIAAAMGGMTFFYYRYRSYKELGGITGDTAGYFVTICEAAFVAAAAVCQVVGL